MLGRLDIANVAVEGVVGLGGGWAQRMAWEQTNNTGWFVTAAFVFGGLAAKMFSRPGDLLDRVGETAFHSGTTVAGWVGTEMTMLNKQPGRPGMLPAGRRATLGGRAPVGAANGIHPNVSVGGINPVTGEQIRGSSI